MDTATKLEDRARPRSRPARCGASRRCRRWSCARKGARHSILRDKRSVTHHYNLSNEYFSLFLDESMTYSCAIWSRGAQTLEEAQLTKLELVCTKLGLQPGDARAGRRLRLGRVRDPRRARARRARHRDHAERAAGALARERAAAAGLADQVDIRVMDYREIAGETFDAIASIGMVEHVGSVNVDLYMAKLASLLKPGGTLLNHGIARLRVGDAEAGPFSERYVWPDAAPLHVSRIQTAIERAGLHTRHVEDFPDDYARTLLEWQHRFEANLDRARRARRGRARARLADLPAGVPSGLRERLLVRLPSPSGASTLAIRIRHGRHPATREVRAHLSPPPGRFGVVTASPDRSRPLPSAAPLGVQFVPEVFRRSRPVAARRGRARQERHAVPLRHPGPRDRGRAGRASTCSPSPPRAPARRSPSARPIIDMLDPKHRRTAALVLAPTRELVSQIVEEVRPMAESRGIRVASVYGGVGFEKQIKLARAAHMIVATPGRLEDLLAPQRAVARRRRDPRPRRGRPHARHGLPPGRRPARRQVPRGPADAVLQRHARR